MTTYFCGRKTFFNLSEANEQIYEIYIKTIAILSDTLDAGECGKRHVGHGESIAYARSRIVHMA